MFFLVVLIFCISFYPLMGHYFRKKSKLFMSCHHPTNSGYLFLSIKNLMRNFLRGSVFYFLHEFYVAELIALSMVEISTMGLMIFLEKKKKIFKEKFFFYCGLAYHLLLVLLNASLYLGYAHDNN